MFKTIYRCPRTISSHENGPLSESRRHYLEHLAAQGASRRTIRGAAEVIDRAAIYMRLDPSSPVERTDVEQAAKDWANRPFGNANLVAPYHAMKELGLLITCGWLRFAQRLREPAGPPIPHERELNSYCRSMDAERGLSPATVATSRQQAIKFFHYAARKSLKRLRIGDVERFLAWLGEQGWTRAGIRTAGHLIRRFFHYGESEGWTPLASALRFTARA